VQRRVEEPALRGRAFAQANERVAPRVVAEQRRQHRAHVGDPLRTTGRRPAIELKIEAHVGVELVPSDVEDVRRTWSDGAGGVHCSDWRVGMLHGRHRNASTFVALDPASLLP